MIRLREAPWLELVLLFFAYLIVGYYAGEWLPSWNQLISRLGEHWGWLPSEGLALKLFYLAGAALVLGLTLLLATPMALSRLVFGNFFQSDNRAIVYLLTWSLAAVFIARWFQHFTLPFILIFSTILSRLGLQRMSLKGWQVSLILLAICLGGFESGMLIFMYRHQ